MTYFLPNLNAVNAKGKKISRCVICGRPADFHFPDGSLCADHAVKSGMLGR